MVCTLSRSEIPQAELDSFPFNFFMVLCQVLAVPVALVVLTAEVFVPSLSPQFPAESCRHRHTRPGKPLHYPAAEGPAGCLRAPCAGPGVLPPQDGNEYRGQTHPALPGELPQPGSGGTARLGSVSRTGAFWKEGCSWVILVGDSNVSENNCDAS